MSICGEQDDDVADADFDPAEYVSTSSLSTEHTSADETDEGVQSAPTAQHHYTIKPSSTPGAGPSNVPHTTTTLPTPADDSRRSDRLSRPPHTETKTVTPKRRTVYCYFCEQAVLQFARHLERHHPLELEVQRIAALKKKNKKRKRLISVIRNKGNFLRARATDTMTPVRRPALNRKSSEPLPCTYCYGLFARKQLWRHVRHCPANERNVQTGPAYRNVAQNLLLTQVLGDEYLIRTVFPRMHADRVTAAVKGDPVICAYGARFSKTHRDDHHVNLISRKMRELGKLLLELRRTDPNIKSLVDVLNPTHYKRIVECTKSVAGFDYSTRKYKSPTYALNMQTALKECCEVTCSNLYQHGHFPDKNAYEEAEFPFRRLMATIAANWKYDISHEAANTLHTAGMNKITIVPLASDLYKFRQYLIQAGAESTETLKHNGKDVLAFKNLTEIVYCRVMLLCRKRCGELSRLTVELYEKCSERSSYEEFAEILRPSEMLLVRKYKRVVIQGKRKATPVIFTHDVQDHIQTLLGARGNFLPDSNPYLFGNPNTSNPIPGYKVVNKQAVRAGLTKPEAITTRCLRKHLATVCQVLNMTDQEVEQLATFMGHSVAVHRNEYRLPDDIFQTAKVSKLLLMMETGRAGHFEGKTMDEIELDMQADIFDEGAGDEGCDTMDSHIVDEDDYDKACGSRPMLARTTVALGSGRPHTKKIRTKKFERVPWTVEQKRLAQGFFRQHLIDRRAPNRGECTELMSLHPDVFKNRTWQKLKAFIVNEYCKKR